MLWLIVGETAVLMPIMLYLARMLFSKDPGMAASLRLVTPWASLGAPLIAVGVTTLIGYWRTDANGLTRINLWGYRTFLAWTDVIGAKTTRSSGAHGLLPCNYYQLSTRRGRRSVPITYLPKLGGSIIQHLQPLGKADGLELTQDILSFWTPIPDDIAEEMDWNRERGHGVSRVELRRDRLTVTKGGVARTIHWDQVTNAAWALGALRVMVGSWPTVIPFVDGDRNSATLILAITKRLRTLDHPLPVIIPGTVAGTLGIWPGPPNGSAE